MTTAASWQLICLTSSAAAPSAVVALASPIGRNLHDLGRALVDDLAGHDCIEHDARLAPSASVSGD
jgi:hypothetical protein